MKKTLLATLIAIMLVVSLVSAIPATSAADDLYIIFVNGGFPNGGSIVDGCGTIIKDRHLIGGEGMKDGEPGAGWFQIAIDDSGTSEAWLRYNYLAIQGKSVPSNLTGTPEAAVLFGAGNKYTFRELGGSSWGGAIQERTVFLDLSKVDAFESNCLILSNGGIGYDITEIWLTNVQKSLEENTTEDPSGTTGPTTGYPGGSGPPTQTTTDATVATDNSTMAATNSNNTTVANNNNNTTVNNNGNNNNTTVNYNNYNGTTNNEYVSNPKTDVAGLAMVGVITTLALCGLVVASKKKSK